MLLFLYDLCQKIFHGSSGASYHKNQTPYSINLCFVDDLEIEPLIETCTSIENESEPIYGNVGVCIIPPVRVEDLWDYVKLNKENSMEGLRKEYRVRIEQTTLNILLFLLLDVCLRF